MGHVGLRTKVISIINNAIQQLDEEKVTTLVDLLFSDQIGITSISDLAEVDQDMLSGCGLAPVPLKKLLRSFKNTQNASANHPGSTSEAGSTDHSSRRPGNNRQENADDQLENNATGPVPPKDGDFRYKVNWNDMPHSAVSALRLAKEQGVPGSEEAKHDLKIGLAEKMKEKYIAFRKANPSVLQKTPGVDCCRDVAEQVYTKFGKAIQDVLGTLSHGDGRETLTIGLVRKLENDFRKIPNPCTSEPPGVSRGRGVPGVLPEQYNPPLSKPEKNRQVLLRKELQEIALLDDNEKDWIQINNKMAETFELQRELIVEITKTIIRRSEEEESENNENEDEIEERLIEKIKKTWPFLFTLKAMSNHHQQLTGRNLEEKFNNFFTEGDLKYLLVFLTCSSSSNIVNAMLKMKVEENMRHMTNGSKLLLAVCMLANHFKEKWQGVLIFPTEKTTQPSEVEASVQTLTTNICIVALGEDVFSAEYFYICIDKVCVAETSNAGNALLILLQLCFILDLQYPEGLARTFEFFERIILEMTPTTTRVRDKKGKLLLVLSEPVRTTGKKFVQFLKDARENIDGTDFD